MTQQMTGAEMVIQAMIDQGVEHIFGYPGGAVLPIYDAMFQQEKLRHILVRHEQGAVHAAEGYARSTGKVGCVLVTSGPGATNAVTGLTDALMDSIPLVCITGQVPTHLIGNDAFQECDTVGITRPCTKHNYLVKSVNDLARVLHEAFHIAANGRPGPVVVDIPKDVQFATGTYLGPKAVQMKSYKPKVKGDLDKIKAAVDMLANAKKPIIYSGGGIINSGKEASHLLREFARLTGFPVTSTLMGLGAFPAANPQWLGMLGMHGTYEANWTMHDCDVMLCIGARFDDRITGRIDAFSPGSRKIHIDIDASSINKNVKVDIPIVGDCAHVLEDMIRIWRAEAKQPDKAALAAWWKQIDKWRSRNCLAYRQSNETIKPQYAIQRLYELTKDRDVYITTEVGQHQMWAAQFFKFEEPNRWMTTRRARHHGLRPAGLGRRAARASEIAGDRHRGRGLGADDHAGDVDRRAVPAADQDLHPQQPVHGHGAAVAGAAARRALFGELLGGAAGLRQARRGLSRRRHPLREAGRSRSRHQGDDQRRQAGDLRLHGRSDGKLLPDDPVGQGAQRDAARRRRGRHRQGDRRKGQGAGVMSNGASASHYPAATVKEHIERHTLSVLVDNEPGVLARVIGLFSGRGYNIDSLTVSETEHEKHLSRITIVTSGTPMVIEQIRHQLERLVQVQRVVDLTESGPAIERELAMVKVRGKGDAPRRGAAACRRVPRARDRRHDRELHLRDHRRERARSTSSST